MGNCSRRGKSGKKTEKRPDDRRRAFDLLVVAVGCESVDQGELNGPERLN